VSRLSAVGDGIAARPRAPVLARLR